MWDSRCPAQECHVSFAHLNFGRWADGDDLRSAGELVTTNFVPHLAGHVERLLASGRLCVQFALDRPVAKRFKLAVAIPRIILELEAAELEQILEALQLQGAEIISIQCQGGQTRQIVKRSVLDVLQSVVRQCHFLQVGEIEE